jgi:hypothetical protein
VGWWKGEKESKYTKKGGAKCGVSFWEKANYMVLGPEVEKNKRTNRPKQSAFMIDSSTANVERSVSDEQVAFESTVSRSRYGSLG